MGLVVIQDLHHNIQSLNTAPCPSKVDPAFQVTFNTVVIPQRLKVMVCHTKDLA